VKNQTLTYLLNKMKPWNQNSSHTESVLAQITTNFHLVNYGILNTGQNKVFVNSTPPHLPQTTLHSPPATTKSCSGPADSLHL